jgi:Tfp pilus assembly protein PilV
MKTSKVLVSTLSALSVMGVIGFAYAQNQNSSDKSSGQVSSPLVVEAGGANSQAMPSHPALQEHEKGQTGSTSSSAARETDVERERARALRDMSNEKPTGAGESSSGELVARADRN